MMPFGETVLAWRLARGLTQEALARGARVTRPNLSAIERGDRDVTLRTLRALAVALSVRPGVLADGEGPEAAPGPGLGREALERVAGAAGGRSGPLASPAEARLAARLATVTRARRGGAPRTPGRGADRAYLLLRAGQAPETIASLVDRVGGSRRQSGARDRADG